MDNESIPRREFLKDTASLLPVTTATTDATQSDTQLPSEDSFQPESFWQDRMQPPDDGKNYGWFIDTRRCFGCHACEVSCKAENDVPLGHFIRQTFYKDVGQYPKVARMFLPMACQHCEDAPCIKACPCGAPIIILKNLLDVDRLRLWVGHGCDLVVLALAIVEDLPLHLDGCFLI